MKQKIAEELVEILQRHFYSLNDGVGGSCEIMDYKGCVLALIGWMRQYIQGLIGISEVEVEKNLFAYQSHDLIREGVKRLKEEILKRLRIELYTFTTHNLGTKSSLSRKEI